VARRRISQLILLAVLATTTSARADEAKLDEVQRDVLRLSKAVYSGDVDAVLGLTHPRIIEVMGGQEAARVNITLGRFVW